jgi:hypothetical protein
MESSRVGSFRDPTPAVTGSTSTTGRPSPQPTKRSQKPDVAGFRHSITASEAAAVARDGVGVRSVGDATNKEAFRSVISKAHDHGVDKGTALREAVRAHERNQHRQRPARADGGTVATRQWAANLSDREKAALLAGGLVLALAAFPSQR